MYWFSERMQDSWALGEMRERVGEPRPLLAMRRSNPCLGVESAKATWVHLSVSSTDLTESPNMYSALSFVASYRIFASVPLRISVSDVKPFPFPLRSTPNCALVWLLASTNAIPSSLVVLSRMVPSSPMRRMTSRPAPGISVFCPTARSAGARSTTVAYAPARASQKARGWTRDTSTGYWDTKI